MDKTTLRDSVRNQPFKPFVLRIEDGQEFRIDDPDSVAMSPKQEVAILFVGDHYHVIDTTKITSLEVLP